MSSEHQYVIALFNAIASLRRVFERITFNLHCKTSIKCLRPCLNIFKLFYHIVVGLMSRLHIYEERTGKYLSYFKHYVSNARVIVDVGCGAGAFSKALARQGRLVIALDIEERLLRGIENPYIEKVCGCPPPPPP